MIAVWLEDGRLSVRDVAVPRPPPGEARVRVTLAGICNTDLELMRGYYPFRGILGHEFVGVVDEGPERLVGRHVVGEINAVCRACRACRAGRASHCERRTVLGIVDRDGAFAARLTLPIDNLHEVPDDVSDERAVFTEPLAAALQVQEQVEIGRRDRVLVVGAGKLGQLVARTLALTGCDLTVVGRHAGKLEPLAALGARTLLETELPVAAAGPGAAAGPDAAVNAAGAEARGDDTAGGKVPGADAAPGKGDAGFDRAFDVAVECTGNPAGFVLARRGLRPRGTLVMKSTYAGDLTVDAASLVVDEITLVGSRCGPFDKALALLVEGRVEVDDMIEARYPLSEALDALEHAARPGVLKVLLVP